MDDKDNRETICKADRKCFPIFAFCKTKFSKDIRGNDLASRAVVVPQKRSCVSQNRSRLVESLPNTLQGGFILRQRLKDQSSQ